jgi:transcription elongation factor Elf1
MSVPRDGSCPLCGMAGPHGCAVPTVTEQVTKALETGEIVCSKDGARLEPVEHVGKLACGLCGARYEFFIQAVIRPAPPDADDGTRRRTTLWHPMVPEPLP